MLPFAICEELAPFEYSDINAVAICVDPERMFDAKIFSLPPGPIERNVSEAMAAKQRNPPHSIMACHLATLLEVGSQIAGLQSAILRGSVPSYKPINASGRKANKNRYYSGVVMGDSNQANPVLTPVIACIESYGAAAAEARRKS